MRLAVRTGDEVAALSVRTLGLDEEIFPLDYPEAVCASLRRAASFLCPSTPRALVDTVWDVLAPLMDAPLAREDLMDFVEQLISTGDLLELADTTADRSARLLYLGPPSFVEKSPGRFLVTGVRPHGAPLVPSGIAVEYEGHTRTILLDVDGPDARLRELGLHRFTAQQWVGQPSTISARVHTGQYRERLDVGRESGAIDGLTIIDPAARTTYYRGRWRPPALGDTGDFVGRRPQAFGADRWCVVRLLNGEPKRLIDLPLANSASPARDDAWRLQAAIDAERGTPGVCRMLAIPGTVPTAEYVIDFFAPLTSWAERYLELVGTPVDKSRGALFSYRILASALGGLRSVLTDTLWMAMTEGERE